MFEELEKAIDSQNYSLAQTILEQLTSQKIDSLWLKYYQTLIIEKEEKLIEAEQDYRQIIKDSIYPDPKLINLIRNGIERIIKIKKQREEIKQQQHSKIKKAKKQEFTNVKENQELAVLILEDVS